VLQSAGRRSVVQAQTSSDPLRRHADLPKPLQHVMQAMPALSMLQGACLSESVT